MHINYTTNCWTRKKKLIFLQRMGRTEGVFAFLCHSVSHSFQCSGPLLSVRVEIWRLLYHSPSESLGSIDLTVAQRGREGIWSEVSSQSSWVSASGTHHYLREFWILFWRQLDRCIWCRQRTFLTHETARFSLRRGFEPGQTLRWTFKCNIWSASYWHWPETRWRKQKKLVWKKEDTVMLTETELYAMIFKWNLSWKAA